MKRGSDEDLLLLEISGDAGGRSSSSSLHLAHSQLLSEFFGWQNVHAIQRMKFSKVSAIVNEYIYIYIFMVGLIGS